jgi:hypothetical protein
MPPLLHDDATAGPAVGAARNRQTPSRSPHPADRTARALSHHDSPPGPTHEFDLIRVAPGNPLRPPCWRWELARAYTATGAEDGGPGLDDAWVRRALAFQRRAAGDPCEIDRDVVAARALGAAADPRKRWEVESRVLAGQDDAAVAARCGLTSGVVAAYEALFFAVRGRLEQTAYIRHLAIEPQLYAAPEDQDLGVVLRLFGYQGGPHVVDAMVGALFGGATPGCSPRTAELVRAAVHAFFLPTEGRDARLTLRLYGRLLEAEAGATARAAVPAFAAVVEAARAAPVGPPDCPAPDATVGVTDAAADPAPAPTEPAGNDGGDGADALPPPPCAA